MKRFFRQADNCILALTVLCVALLAVLLVYDAGYVGILTTGGTGQTQPILASEACVGEPQTAQSTVPASPAAEAGQQTGTAAPGPVNLNTATVQELTTLPGIGQVLAQRIVTWREENGAFAAVEDIQNVTGIGQSRFEALQGLVTVE